MAELKPCPFCGGTPELIIESSFDATGLYAVANYYKIACARCFACSGKIGYKAIAIAAWNRRAGEDGN